MFGSWLPALLNIYAPHRWLVPEVLIIAAWTLYCGLRKQMPNARWDLLVLCVHFCNWTWVGIFWGWGPLLALAIFGAFASLAWIFYSRTNTAATREA
jgi:hypothetical protein